MKLARLNTVLLILIILINGITIILPFWPALLFRLENADGKNRQALYHKIQADEQPEELAPNRLIIPSILFDGQIHGGDAGALKHGVWLRPISNQPGNSNKVLVAHRFTYNHPRGAFYNLDKLKPGDLVALIWENRTIRYTVREVKVVSPHDTYIENPTQDARLTLYTCTPLILPKDRLVVIATPEKSNSQHGAGQRDKQ